MYNNDYEAVYKQQRLAALAAEYSREKDAEDLQEALTLTDCRKMAELRALQEDVASYRPANGYASALQPRTLSAYNEDLIANGDAPDPYFEGLNNLHREVRR